MVTFLTDKDKEVIDARIDEISNRPIPTSLPFVELTTVCTLDEVVELNENDSIAVSSLVRNYNGPIQVKFDVDTSSLDAGTKEDVTAMLEQRIFAEDNFRMFVSAIMMNDLAICVGLAEIDGKWNFYYCLPA